jgi:hypothetical protein
MNTFIIKPSVPIQTVIYIKEDSWLCFDCCEGSFCWWNCHLTVITLAGSTSLSDAYHLNSPSRVALPKATSPLVQPSNLLAFANLKSRQSRPTVLQIDLISRPKCYLSFSFLLFFFSPASAILNLVPYQELPYLSSRTVREISGRCGNAEGRKYLISNRNRLQIYLGWDKSCPKKFKSNQQKGLLYRNWTIFYLPNLQDQADCVET